MPIPDLPQSIPDLQQQIIRQRNLFVSLLKRYQATGEYEYDGTKYKDSNKGLLRAWADLDTLEAYRKSPKLSKKLHNPHYTLTIP